MLALATLALVGCPAVDISQYDAGYAVGFAEDDWYWQGYDDGYDTVDFEPIYYQGGTIPVLEDGSYDAGYYDGIWYAYNDGYFTDYYEAFVLGFSEGYDNAYWEDYLDFLANDMHTEYFHGGWIDGYEDGFSEGRVFGAFDYESDLPFDWEDALADYESGTDLYFEEVDVGTGEFGPVVLYEYGFDPLAKSSLSPGSKRFSKAERRLAVRQEVGTKSRVVDLETRGAATPERLERLNVAPEASKRDGRALRLTTTWSERIRSYTAGKNTAETERAGLRVSGTR
jgi:hypothetical protein